MKKRFLGMLLAVLMVLTLLPAAAFADGELSGTCGDNVTWKLEGDTLTISGTGPIYDYYVNTVPWKPYSDSVVKIVIGEGVTRTGDNTFTQMRNLISVSLPQSLEIISSSFRQCISLTDINIPDGVWRISSSAFRECRSLKEVNIPKNCIVIDAYAFDECRALESIVIPEGIIKINDYAFEWCTSLKEIYLPQSLCELCTSAFDYCESLESIYYGGSIRQWKEQVTISYRDVEQEGYKHGYGQAAIYFDDESDPFTDIDCAFHDYIVAGYAADILNGYPDNTFRPNQSVTRAQFVTMLYNMCGKPDISGYGELEFKDTSSISSAYKDAVLWGYLGGIVSGYSDGTFRPNATATRGASAKIIVSVYIVAAAMLEQQ